MIVRKLRLERGFSQEQLASMAGVSVRTLQRIERGANPSAETLKCLAAVLETDFSTLRKERDMTAAADIPKLPEDEQHAMEYVRDIRGFYIHAVQYVVVIACLAAINLFTSPGYLWFLWAALGWGIGVAVHGLSCSRSSICSATTGKGGRSQGASPEPGRTATQIRDPHSTAPCRFQTGQQQHATDFPSVQPPLHPNGVPV